MSDILNRVRVLAPSATGTSSAPLGSAYSPKFMTPAEAGAIDGRQYTWLFEQGDDFEISKGAWTASGNTAARTETIVSKIAGTVGQTKLNLNGTAVVSVVRSAEDMTVPPFGARLAKTAAYTVTSNDDGSTIALGGAAFYTLTFPTASGFASSHKNVIVNDDTGRAKNIVITGGANFVLWPGQTAIVYNDNSVWRVSRNYRWRLTGNVTLNVDPVNGSDSNDGLATGAGNALATFQKAYDTIADNFDVAGYAVTMLSAASQTYTNAGIKTFKGVIGQGTAASILVDGNSSTFTNNDSTYIFRVGSDVTSEGAFPARFGIRRAKMTGTNASGGVNSNGGVIWLLDGIEFGQMTNACHMQAIGGGAHVTIISQSYTISGGGRVHASAWSGGFVVIQSDTVTLTGTPAFGDGFAEASWYGQIYAGFTTFTGAATGPRYNIRKGGYIDTQSSSLTYLPGDAAATVNSNALYENRFQNILASLNSAAAPTQAAGTSLSLNGADGAISGAEIISHANQGILAFRRADGSGASPQALAADVTIGGVQWWGYDTAWRGSANAAIQCNAGELWTGTARGTYITFFTTPNTTTAIAEKARLTPRGSLGVGVTTDSGAGTVQLKSQTFASLDAASSTNQGAIATVTDSTTNVWGATITGGGSNKVLAFSNGTNWTVIGK